MKNAKCFVWTSLTSDTGIAAIEHCIQVAKSNGVLVVGAPSISIIQKRTTEAMRLLKQCTITSMNEEELEALTNEKDVRSAISILLGWGLEVVQVTLGKVNKENNKLINISRMALGLLVRNLTRL